MNRIQQKIKYYKTLLIKVENSILQNNIKGYLEIKKFKEVTAYYHVQRINGKLKRKYLNKSNHQTKKLLAQKSYNKQVKKYLENKINFYNKIEKLFEPKELEDIYNELSKERQELVKPIIPTNKQVIDAWLKKNPKTNTYKEENKVYKTKSDIMVRSKSEALASDELTNRELKHIYEPKVQLKDRVVYPDFAIMHPKTLEIIYWEHFGMMDVESYREEALSKIVAYEKSGIIRGKNLIVTFESNTVKFDREWIGRILDEYFGK